MFSLGNYHAECVTYKSRRVGWSDYFCYQGNDNGLILDDK
jgi:hypothetical protein